jgi:protein-S-isoprenylcysteine O-methyltransferase Ste14
VSNKTKEVKTHAGVKVPPFLLVLIHVGMAFGLKWWIPLPLIVPLILRTLGFVLVIIGFLLGLAALYAFRQARPTRRPRGGTQPLITSGIYRFTRNPIYLGFLLMLVGIPLNGGSYWGLILTPLMIFLLNRLVITPEEQALGRKFGTEYSNYTARVRRWI